MMSNLEIASTYRQAKQPLKQIGILAELNGVSRKEIAEILRSEGCELPARYQEKDPSQAAEAASSPQGASQGAAAQDAGEAGHLISQPEADSFPSRGSQEPLRKLKRFLRAVILLEELLEDDDV